MRSIWLHEQEFLETLLPTLKRSDMEFPTDLFFLDVLPVIPTNCRPVSKHYNLFVLSQDDPCVGEQNCKRCGRASSVLHFEADHAT